MLPGANDAIHIFRYLRIELDVSTGCRVDNAKSLGMQGLTPKFLDQFAQYRIADICQPADAAIIRISQQGMAGLGEMDSYLVGPTGLQGNFQQRYPRIAADDPPVGHRIPAMPGFT